MRYVKIYKSLQTGSLAAVGGPGYYLWPVFLLESDMGGVVDIHPGVLARKWGVDVSVVREAIALWEAPDPDSTSPGEDGRRLIRLDHRDWGWRIVNWDKYLLDEGYERAKEATRKRVKRLRDRRKALQSGAETGGNATAATGIRDKGSGKTPVESSVSTSPSAAAELPRAAAAEPGELKLEGTAGEVEDKIAGTLPLVDGTHWPVPAKLIAEWTLAYPAINVTTELRQMKAWFAANPKQRKTPRGIHRFVVGWLAKEQDRPKGVLNGTGGPAKRERPPTPAEIAAARAADVARNKAQMEKLGMGTGLRSMGDVFKAIP